MFDGVGWPTSRLSIRSVARLTARTLRSLFVGVGGGGRVDRVVLAASHRAHLFANHLACVDHLALHVREHHVGPPRADRRFDAAAQSRRSASDPHAFHHALSAGRRVPVVPRRLHHARVQVVRKVGVELRILQRHRGPFGLAVSHYDFHSAAVASIGLYQVD